MKKLTVFNFLSLNGYYKDGNNNTDWHVHGVEENAYSEEMLQAENTLLFGRITYQMMEGFWPTTYAGELFPAVARAMNASEKIVFSNTLKEAGWENTRIIGGDIIAAMKDLKLREGNNLALLGSGTVLTQFAEAGLIDRYEIMIDPVVITQGTSIFSTITTDLHLKLVESRVFKSGVVLLCYEPADA